VRRAGAASIDRASECYLDEDGPCSADAVQGDLLRPPPLPPPPPPHPPPPAPPPNCDRRWYVYHRESPARTAGPSVALHATTWRACGARSSWGAIAARHRRGREGHPKNALRAQDCRGRARMQGLSAGTQGAARASGGESRQHRAGGAWPIWSGGGDPSGRRTCCWIRAHRAGVKGGVIARIGAAGPHGAWPGGARSPGSFRRCCYHPPKGVPPRAHAERDHE